MKITNWLKYTEYMPILASIIDNDAEITNLYRNPNSENLRILLWDTILKKLQSTFDNSQGENTLRSVLEGILVSFKCIELIVNHYSSIFEGETYFGRKQIAART